VLVGALLAGTAVSDASAANPLRLRLSMFRVAGQGTVVVVEVSNASALPIERIVAKVIVDGKDRRLVAMGTVYGGATAVRRITYRSVSNVAEAYLTGIAAGRPETAAAFAMTPQRGSGTSGPEWWLAAVLSLAGVLLGGGLAFWASARSDAATSEREWGRLLYESNQDALRGFVDGWRGDTNPEVLKAQFERLRERAFLPLFVMEQCDMTLTVLTSQASQSKKEEASRELLAVFDAIATNPWKLGRGRRVRL